MSRLIHDDAATHDDNASILGLGGRCDGYQRSGDGRVGENCY